MNTGDLPLLPEERRIVTVLFADVTGFTAMAEPMDMEDVRDLMDACWQRLDGAILRHGGRIDKHIGDAVMAVWGAPHAGEDDAASAVRAGLALQRELESFNRERPGTGLRIRVGINTGPALAGTVGSLGEYTVIGDTVNLASRIQTMAEPGTVVIGPQTFEEVRGLFDVEPLAPVPVRGKTGPRTAFRVEAEKVHPSRVRYRGSSEFKLRLVGRNAELKSLMAIYARAAARRRPVVALVVGEAGLGKSRLMMEFARTLELRPEHPLILSARGLAQTARVPFGLWRAMWNNRLRLDEADAPGASGDQFAKGMLEMWGSSLSAIPGVEVAHVVGGLIGFDFPNSPYLAALSGSPRRARERAFELTAQLFARAGARAPLVLMFDDLHWADDGTLDLIEHLLAERGSDLPLLILGGARTGIGNRLTGWRTHEAIQTITLNPLPTNPEIVKEVFKQAETLPGSWLALLAERSGGNPYFLEELVRALIRQGAILVKPDGWRASGDGPLDVALPDTLHSLLQSRLDALPAEVKAVAQAAAVVGRVFWVGAVQAILHTAADTGLLTAPLDENGWRTMVESALETMQHNELAFQRVGSGSNGDREFIFKHHLLRDTAYEMLPKKYRRRFHAAAATWLAGHGGYPALIADHLEQAGEYTRAIMYYRQAAEDAAARGASAEAQALTERRQAVERQMQKIGTGPL